MALVTVDDVRDDLDPLRVTADSSPNATQVARFIDAVEGQVKGIALAAGLLAWPTDPTSTAGLYLTEVVREGVRCRVLRTKYAVTARDSVPAEVGLSCQAYQAAIKLLAQVAGTLNTTDVTFPMASVGLPLLGTQDDAPRRTGSFGEWTGEVAARDARAGRGGVVR